MAKCEEGGGGGEGILSKGGVSGKLRADVNELTH